MRNVMKRIFLLIFICSIMIVACNQPKQDPNSLRVGTISGPETQLMEKAKKIALNKYGLNIKIVEFNDYNTPNLALNDGSIDANLFQHQPYLDSVVKERGYPIVSAAKVFIYPMAAYSRKINDIKELPHGAIVAIPNDPSNEGRALLLLDKENLIDLGDKKHLTVTPNDIKSNPKKLSFKEMDAAQLPRVLPDVDIAVINTNYAMIARLTPTKDALILEDKSSPYANIIAVKKENLNDPRIKKLIKTLHSEEVRQEAKRLFHGGAIPAW